MSDQSLTDHSVPGERYTHRGLDYPLGQWAPPADRPHEVAPGVRWLRMPLPFSLDHINLWLLDDRDENGPGTAIVDTGLNAPVCRDVWQAILPGLHITRVIVTHFHPDHVGLAGWLCEKTGAPLDMARTEYLYARNLQLDARETPPAEAIALALDAGWPAAAIAKLQAQKWRMFASATAPLPGRYHRLCDGDQLSIGGRNWRIVVGRGHAPEHVCLVDEAGQVMIAGDQVLPRISSNVSLPLMEPMADPLGDWLDSIEQFRALPEDLLVLPSHGHPFHGLHERLAQLAQGHAERLDALRTFCATPKTAYECFPVLFSRAVDDSMISLATGEALAHLRRLEVQGLMRRERYGTALWFTAV